MNGLGISEIRQGAMALLIGRLRDQTQRVTGRGRWPVPVTNTARRFRLFGLRTSLTGALKSSRASRPFSEQRPCTLTQSGRARGAALPPKTGRPRTKHPSERDAFHANICDLTDTERGVGARHSAPLFLPAAGAGRLPFHRRPVPAVIGGAS